ncbi:Intraflagellar transport protein 80 [Fasciolopsis buskii]|uniref:Intraflagellar transport protein 80 n=1 Tax=Fasciolopsis buskii TaxID=27845 RepID=A0A8E0RW49_9TREM|nr:Intraflagellar transport protein 80 [Fasciolopsis buski]
MQANVKPVAWKAHDGIVLKIDWSSVTDHIISGGEDCRYKVWDSFGRLLFTSNPFMNPVTSLAWSPDGQLFVVGSYDTLHLCDKRGWSFAVEKTRTGSLYNLRWSGDGTQIAGAGGNGQIIVGQITHKWMEWNGFEAAITEARTVEVHNVRNGAKENLEFRDRIPKASIGFNYMVVATTSQCYVYSTKNFNTPAIADLKENQVTVIVQCPKYYVLVDGTSIYVYTYDARLVCSPRHAHVHTELLHSDVLAASNDTLAVTNRADEKSVYLFDISNGKPLGDGKPIVHSAEIVKIGLDQCGQPLDRRLALLDRNKDLYLMSIRVFGTNRKLVKLSTMATSFVWCDTSNLLAAVSNDTLSVWFHPNIAFIDNDLLNSAMLEMENHEEFGKHPELLNFYRDRLRLRRTDGSEVSFTVSPFPDKIHQLILLNKWNEALSLCRNVKDKLLWACLAGFATYAKDLDIAEIAFSEIEEVDKVEYLRYIKSLPTKELRTAELLLLSGEHQDAEGVLLQAGMRFRAIMLNLNAYRWERALELSLKYGLASDIVLSSRMAYLQQFESQETLGPFLQQPKQNALSVKTLKERIAEEYQKEEERNSRPETGDNVPVQRGRQPVTNK